MRASVFIAALAIATASELASKPTLTQSRSCVKSTTTATKPLPALAVKRPPTKHELRGGTTVSAEGLPSSVKMLIGAGGIFLSFSVFAVPSNW